MQTVAIVGAGPSGLVTARWLKREGFEPVIFEQGRRLGGQWTADDRYSGIWPSMRTNTSRLLTAFSDLAHEPHTAIFPTNRAIQAYLQRYAEQFDLVSCLRLNTRILHIHSDQRQDSWLVRSVTDDGEPREEKYSNVIVASGRYKQPAIPNIAGLTSFSGVRGIAHAFTYKQPESYRGLRVLVAGCSISALEIASDLAMLGAARVISTNRRQRYILQKLLAGVPLDQLAFTRFSVLSEEYLPMETVERALKHFIRSPAAAQSNSAHRNLPTVSSMPASRKASISCRW